MTVRLARQHLPVPTHDEQRFFRKIDPERRIVGRRRKKGKLILCQRYVQLAATPTSCTRLTSRCMVSPTAEVVIEGPAWRFANGVLIITAMLLKVAWVCPLRQHRRQSRAQGSGSQAACWSLLRCTSRWAMSPSSPTMRRPDRPMSFRDSVEELTCRYLKLMFFFNFINVAWDNACFIISGRLLYSNKNKLKGQKRRPKNKYFYIKGQTNRKWWMEPGCAHTHLRKVQKNAI
jgi:hypothetical protein